MSKPAVVTLSADYGLAGTSWFLEDTPWPKPTRHDSLTKKCTKRGAGLICCVSAGSFSKILATEIEFDGLN